jgi:UDP-xylose/UDP-N-acetylglucosamine transporter B4
MRTNALRFRYTFGQVLSVMAVSVGVLLTTLSASQPIHPADDQDVPASSYATGIGLLSIALVMSGLLGLVQDRTFSRYAPKDGSPPPWKEAMFYIHALALPLFLPSIPALRSQLLAVMSSRPAEHTLPKPVLEFFPPLISKGIMLPSAVLPLALTLATHLPCAAGANALTSTMSSTSVALTLATRKAVSLVISTVILGHAPVRHPSMMSAGAALVFGGSVGWAWAGARTKISSSKGVQSNSKNNKIE